MPLSSNTLNLLGEYDRRKDTEPVGASEASTNLGIRNLLTQYDKRRPLIEAEQAAERFVEDTKRDIFRMPQTEEVRQPLGGIGGLSVENIQSQDVDIDPVESKLAEMENRLATEGTLKPQADRYDVLPETRQPELKMRLPEETIIPTEQPQRDVGIEWKPEKSVFPYTGTMEIPRIKAGKPQGIIRELAETVPAGAYLTAETIARAAEMLTKPIGIDDWFRAGIEESQKSYEKYKPTRGGIVGTVRQGAESTIQSISAGIPGSIVGGFIGGPIGAAVGFALGAGGMFSLAEYSSFMDDVADNAKASGASAEDIKNIQSELKWNGIISAAAEGGLEAASDLFMLKVIGLLGGKALKAPAKKGLTAVLKKVATTYGKLASAEIPTEMATAAIQVGQRRKAGIKGLPSSWEAAKSVIGPVAVQTALMFGAGALARKAGEPPTAPPKAEEVPAVPTEPVIPEVKVKPIEPKPPVVPTEAPEIIEPTPEPIVPEKVPPVAPIEPEEIVGIKPEEVKPEISDTIMQAFKDWKEDRAYIDNKGNYHVRKGTSRSGPIAKWNKEVKAQYKTNEEFHKAATKELAEIAEVKPGIEVKAVGKDKTVTVDVTPKKEASITPKEQKQYLIDEIDKAIDVTTVEIPEHLTEYNYEDRKKQYGTVTIEVPNDGTFTILNTKETLNKFKETAGKKFPAKKEVLGERPKYKKPSSKPTGHIVFFDLHNYIRLNVLVFLPLSHQ